MTSARINRKGADGPAAPAAAEGRSPTVDEMLRMTCDTLSTQHAADIGRLVRAATAWGTPATRDAGRTIIAGPDGRVRRSGSGRRHRQSALADEGPGVRDHDPGADSRRHRGTDHRIGLPPSRTLIEADGGRLLLTDPTRATFWMFLLDADPTGPPHS